MTSLNTDFDLMHVVAGQIDTRNEEIRAMLGSFIGRMSSVPPSVWGAVLRRCVSARSSSGGTPNRWH